ncbi:MAG: hypothetical protein SPF30_04800 [Arcanobacterium sp.]|nr:hypothetical protein [Arcanobacterium sp.]
MKRHRLLALAIATCAVLGISACSRPEAQPEPQSQPQSQNAPTASTEPLAPQLPPAPHQNSVAVEYTVSKILVAGNDVCVFDSDGRLIVFSENVGVSKDHTALVAKGISIPEGQLFWGAKSENLTSDVMCGGKKYPAKHIYGAGLQDFSHQPSGSSEQPGTQK